MTMTNYLMVKAQSSYDAIVSQPISNNLKVATSTKQGEQVLEVENVICNNSTEVRVRKLWGEQALAWEYYV